MRSLIKSFKFAFCGIFYAIKNERNFRIHLTASIFVLLFSIMAEISKYEALALVFIITFVIFAELINTAIELACDNFGGEFSTHIKHAKDVSASSVLCVAMSSVVIGLIVFLPKMTTIIANLNLLNITILTILFFLSLVFIFKGEKK